MISMPESAPVPPGVDPTTPSPARIYDYVLGGTHNFPADREAAERIRARSPDLADAAWVNRAFHQRAARWMAAEQGIGQFIDIGSGLPTQSNTHGVVQKIIPRARVAYVDHDPMVAAYAGELLSHDGTTAVINADLRDVDAVLDNPALRALIDFDRPAGLLMTAVLHFVADDADPWGLVARYADALAPGSYLALSHITYEGLPPRLVEEGVNVYAQAQGVYPRSREQIERFFAGLQILPPYPGAEPAITHLGLWGADAPELADSDGSHWWFGGVARRT
jgi:S-adenosyl methyltransferase